MIGILDILLKAKAENKRQKKLENDVTIKETEQSN
tara:strand:- start:2967 stop:3071 length:105 start_codon:yes stop_codon:yes gene_type:complete